MAKILRWLMNWLKPRYIDARVVSQLKESGIEPLFHTQEIERRK